MKVSHSSSRILLASLIAQDEVIMESLSEQIKNYWWGCYYEFLNEIDNKQKDCINT